VLKDIPHPDDFERNGLAFLNLAWDSIAELSQTHHTVTEMMNTSYISEEDRLEMEEVEETYWQNSQPALATAVALAHQGGEFLLKSRIAAISPFLLLSVDKWPANTDGADKSFADFKTVDAQELIKIHDMVCANPLPSKFKTNFENLRKLRNTIMHSVHRERPFTPREGVLAILDIADTLIGPLSWQSVRFKYREQKIEIWNVDASEFNPRHRYAEETMHVIRELLEPAASLKYYDFNKKQHSYFCVGCFEEYAGLVFTVHLKPASSTATEAYCVSCQTTFPVRRKKCDECEGNVFGKDRWDDGWTCLTCNDGWLEEETEGTLE